MLLCWACVAGDEGAQGDSKHVAEALAAAKRQAVVGSGKAGRTSRPSSEVVPDAFLTAMMKAEQAQQRSARAGKAGNGDQLEQLLAKRRQTSNVGFSCNCLIALMAAASVQQAGVVLSSCIISMHTYGPALFRHFGDNECLQYMCWCWVVML